MRAFFVAVLLAASVSGAGAQAMPPPDPDRALLDGVELDVAPVPHRLRPDLVARIVLGHSPAGVHIDSIRLRSKGSWQVRVHGPFQIVVHTAGETTVDHACYVVVDRSARISAFGWPDCAG
jgi:hypothetical protein